MKSEKERRNYANEKVEEGSAEPSKRKKWVAAYPSTLRQPIESRRLAHSQLKIVFCYADAGCILLFALQAHGFFFCLDAKETKNQATIIFPLKI